jgi:predicted ATPase/class 3 adenylate cyclase
MLFTDIEGSTRMAASLGSVWPKVLADHHALVGGAIAANDGFVDGTEGDAFFATFLDPGSAGLAALAALRALRSHAWPAGVGELRVRMGLHVGHVERHATGYVGLELHRAARVAAAAHGGQLLLTGAARSLIGDAVAVESLGVHRLKDFPKPEELFCAVVDGRGADAFPAPRTEPLRRTNLPAGLPTLLGREADLERIQGVLTGEGERLVTLVGRGGVGKTSLALQAATELLDAHSGGVWLVRLANISSPGDVLAALASVVGVDGTSFDSPRDALIARLRARGPTLLVLDNMEHLLGAGAELAALLDVLPQLHLLVTSQAPLRLAVEQCVALDALGDDAALALMERVAARRGGATISAEGVDRDALLEVAHTLDGLPLALELAAARLALLTPAQLLGRLRRSPDVLKARGDERPERQRSLRATVDWTLALLEQEPLALFVRMGAFVGPVELEELELVAGADGLDVLEALTGLLDVALVRRVESGDGRVRFGLSEALRQIAAGLLDGASDGPRWRKMHACRQHELVWAATPSWVPGAVFRAAVAAELEAVAALHWARASGDPLAGALGVASAWLMLEHGRLQDARAALVPVLAEPTGDPEIDSLALVSNAGTLSLLGRVDEARSFAEQAIAIAPDKEARAWGLFQRGKIDTFAGEHEAGIRYMEQATALARDLGPAALCEALVFEAQARLLAGELERAAEQLAEAERIGEPVEAKGLLGIETFRADLAALSGDQRLALELYAQSLEAARSRGDELQIMYDLWGVATALTVLRRDPQALEVAGLAEAQSREIRGPATHRVPEAPEGSTIEHSPAPTESRDALPERVDSVAAAERRLGSDAAAGLKARGHAVGADNRVGRACRIARTHELD